MMNTVKKERSIGKFTRSSDEGKINYTLIPRFMTERVAKLYTEGAKIHGKDNWREQSPEALDSFRESAYRHFLAVMDGKDDEDHYAALIFNLNGIVINTHLQ